MNPQKMNTEEPNKSIGCGLIGLTIFSFIWVILFSGLNLFINWVNEQTIMQISGHSPDYRWITHMVTSLLILVVCLLMAKLVKEPRINRIFKLWTYAAILAVISIPAKTLWLAEQNLTAILQAAALLMVIAGRNLFSRKNGEVSEEISSKQNFSGVILWVQMALHNLAVVPGKRVKSQPVFLMFGRYSLSI